MRGSEVSVQSAADRRAAEAQLQTLIERYAAEHARLIAAVRRWLRKRLPAAHEVVYEYRGFFVVSFSPSGHGYEGVLAVRGCEGGVRLCFNGGKELPDPEKLLKGSGGLVRWIGLESVSALARPEVKELVDEAIARSPVAFAREGNGSVEVRATAAAKRLARGPRKKAVSRRTAASSKKAPVKKASVKKAGSTKKASAAKKKSG